MTKLRGMVVALVALLWGLPALAADKPSIDEIKSLTLAAAALVATDGVDTARERFHADGPFKYGEVYVNVIDTNGTWLVYPPVPKNEGKSVLNVKDSDGRLLVLDIIRVARDQGEGWVNYRWLNPASNRIEPKSSYVKLIPERAAIVYVGVYQ
jgi:cytochrome c